MRISQVTVARVKAPRRTGCGVDLSQNEALELVYVTITTNDGLTGFGAALPNVRDTGETVDHCLTAVDAYRDLMIGESPLRICDLYRQMVGAQSDAPAARAAIDMALHDLMGKHLDMPVVELLGRAHTQLPALARIGLCDVAESLEQVHAFVSEGFRAFKISVGNHLEEDVERLVKVREQFPGELVLGVDPNQHYDCQQLCNFMEATQSLDIAFIEQPCKPELDDALASVIDRSLLMNTPLLADESLDDETCAISFLKTHHLYDALNIKLMKCGGITGAKKLLAIAESAGQQLSWSGDDESIGSVTAAAHVAFSSPASRFFDFGENFEFVQDNLTDGAIIEDGMVYLFDEPGLGLSQVLVRAY